MNRILNSESMAPCSLISILKHYQIKNVNANFWIKNGGQLQAV